MLAVGGGGLLSGAVSGLQEVGWLDVPIIAVETRGADSFNQALKAGRLVTLPDITRWDRRGRAILLARLLRKLGAEPQLGNINVLDYNSHTPLSRNASYLSSI